MFPRLVIDKFLSNVDTIRVVGTLLAICPSLTDCR